jgi:hypothetical protein
MSGQVCCRISAETKTAGVFVAGFAENVVLEEVIWLQIMYVVGAFIY